MLFKQGENINLYCQVKDNHASHIAWLSTNESGQWEDYIYQDLGYNKKIIINSSMVKDDLQNFPILFKDTSID